MSAHIKASLPPRPSMILGLLAWTPDPAWKRHTASQYELERDGVTVWATLNGRHGWNVSVARSGRVPRGETLEHVGSKREALRSAEWHRAEIAKWLDGDLAKAEGPT